MGEGSKTPPSVTAVERPTSDVATRPLEDTVPVEEVIGEVEVELPEIAPDAYLVGDEFARGGLGRIMEATDRRLKRTVALKELLSREPRAEARFVREALITARLQHPNIVPIHEAGRWGDGRRFYAMKLVDGRTLSEALAAAENREERLELLSHVIDVADAIAYAHSEGILHRDLKPANVLVGAFGETVLIDWGLAKDLSELTPEETPPRLSSSSSLDTSDGIVVGTPPYMPPEQAAALPLDERADVYAIGAMLYQVLSGHRPYEEAPPRDVLSEVMKRPPIPLAQHAPDTPSDLIAIVEKAMARERADRYPSAREMADELRRFMAGQLVRAHQYSLVEVVSRFVRRQLAAVATAIFLIAVLIAGGIWSFTNIRVERNQARANAEHARAQVEQLKLEKARSLLNTDPTLALAWEKKLAAPLPGAASVASEALDRGVARHILDGHRDRVFMVRAAPDRREVASASEDGVVRVWDVSNGTSRALTGHERRVSTIAYHPSGRWLASGSHDRTARVWDLEGERHRVLEGHTGAVMHVTFSADGKLLATSSEDQSVRIWEIENGALRTKLTVPGATRDVMAAFSSDGTRIYTAGHGNDIYAFSLVDGTRDVLKGHDAPVSHLRVHGARLASADKEGGVRLWTAEGSVALEGHQGRVFSVAFSDARGWVATAGLDGTVRLFSEDGHQQRILRAHGERVFEVAFSPDGTRLASASWDRTVRLWDLDSFEHVTLLGHDELVPTVAFVADGSMLVSGSWDRTLRAWPLEPYRRRVLSDHRVGVHGVDFAPDGERLASGGHDNLVRIYDASGAHQTRRGHTDHIFRVRFSPTGDWVASSSDDQTVRLWSVADGRSVVLRGHRADVEEIEFSPDGKRLASAGEDDVAWIWDVAQGEGRALEGHTAPVTDVAFGPKGVLIATASRDGSARLWREGAAPVELKGHEDEVWSVAISPDGFEVATASLDGTLRVWSTAGEPLRRYSGLERLRLVAYSPSGRNLAAGGDRLFICARDDTSCRPMVGHGGEVLDLSFAGEEALVSGSADHTVRLWDVETAESHVLRGHRASVFDVTVGKDRVASASADADVRIWPLVLPPKPAELAAWLSQQTSATVQE